MSRWRRAEAWTYFLYDLNTPASNFKHHASFIETWNKKRVGGNLPAWRNFELEDFRDWYGMITVIDLLSPDGSDGRYRLWGGKLADFIGHDLTGHAMSDHRSSKRHGYCYSATDFEFFRAMISERKIGYHVGPVDSSDTNIKQIATVRLPLADDGHTIDRFLSAVYPSIAFPGRGVFE